MRADKGYNKRIINKEKLVFVRNCFKTLNRRFKALSPLCGMLGCIFRDNLII